MIKKFIKKNVIMERNRLQRRTYSFCLSNVTYDSLLVQTQDKPLHGVSQTSNTTVAEGKKNDKPNRGIFESRRERRIGYAVEVR